MSLVRSSDWLKWEGADCVLHPLIHTLPKLNLIQDVEKKNGAETPQGSLENNSKKLSGFRKRFHHLFLSLKAVRVSLSKYQSPLSKFWYVYDPRIGSMRSL